VAQRLVLAEIEPLSAEHDRAMFSCGIERLDAYLKQRASQEQKRDLAVVYVLTFEGSKDIIGYYTLSSYAAATIDFPEELRKHLPKYPVVPATLIGWLAASNNFEGQNLRLGETLLVDALLRAWVSRKAVGSWAVIVDSEPEAKGFYLKYGFIPFPGKPSKLFMPMATIGKLYTDIH
jgi:hypothetical protein